jgi:hypothetical protein
MLASINDLGNIAVDSLLIFLVLAILGLPVPIGMWLCLIVVIVACVVAGN